MYASQISREDWSILSPILDELIELPPTTRTAWIRQQTQLSIGQVNTLERLLAHHSDTGADTVLDPENLGKMRAMARDLRTDEAEHKTNERIGPYVLDRRIGEGGMGEVWLARRADGSFDREVALKLCRSADTSLRMRDRMMRERNVLAGLEHPNIARFYDAGVDARGQPYIAMEYVEGVSLHEYVETNLPDTAVLCRIMIEILNAVQFAHQRLVVHRDLKPSNIMVRPDGSVRLLDFGIAKILDDTGGLTTETQLTRDAGYALTPAYASPEQCARAPMGTSTDVFSCGVIFYELLSGRRPFQEAEANLGRLLQAHSEAPRQIVGALRGTARRDLNAIASCALRDNPDARYESAAAFADDIGRYLRDEPVRSVRGARWYYASKFFRRNRGGVLLGTFSLMALLAAAGLLFHLYQRSETEKLRAQNTERIMSGIFAGLNPVTTDAQSVHPKELIDRSVAALGATAAEPATALRLASIYGRLDLPESALTVIENGLAKARRSADSVGLARLQAMAAQFFAEKRDFERASLALREAQAIVSRPLSFSDAETRWRVELGMAYTLAAQGMLKEAAEATLIALRSAESMGENTLDAVTTTLNQQIEIEKRAGNWIEVTRFAADAEAVARKSGELDPSIAEARNMSAAKANLELGFAAAARDILLKQYENAKVRYPLAHVNRVESALVLAHAKARAGDLEGASRTVNEVSPASLSGFEKFINGKPLTFFLDTGNKPTNKFFTVTDEPDLRAIQMQLLCKVRELFLASVVKTRSELRRIRLQVGLATINQDACYTVKESGGEDAVRTYVQGIDLEVSPHPSAPSGLALAQEDRGKLAYSYALYLAKNGRDAEAAAQLRIADDLFSTNDYPLALTIADVRQARAALAMRRGDFSAALLLLAQSSERLRGRVPADSPRIFLLDWYERLARAGLEGTRPSMNLLPKLQAGKAVGKVPEGVLKELRLWSEKPGDFQWSALPVIQI